MIYGYDDSERLFCFLDNPTNKEYKKAVCSVETLREIIRTSQIFQVRLKRYIFALKIIVPRDIMKREFINNYLSKKTDFQ